MHRDPISETMSSGILPPVRTRVATDEPTRASGQTMLPPVVSGPYRTGTPPGRSADPAAIETVQPAEPIEASNADPDETVEYEIVADEITIELAISEPEPDETIGWETAESDLESEVGAEIRWYADDASSPWEEAAAGDEADLFPNSEADAELFESDELVLLEEDEETGASGEDVEPVVRQAPPPLSPWDLGVAATSSEAGHRAALARAEWESLGQALSDSLVGAGPRPDEPGPHGYELTDEKAAELEEAGTKSPFDRPFIPGTQAISGEAESPMAELVRRLESFAATLRDEGSAALSRAQTGEDRFDALLASIAAGFLAGRVNER